jgi:hypothetical protein
MLTRFYPGRDSMNRHRFRDQLEKRIDFFDMFAEAVVYFAQRAWTLAGCYLLCCQLDGISKSLIGGGWRSRTHNGTDDEVEVRKQGVLTRRMVADGTS